MVRLGITRNKKFFIPLFLLTLCVFLMHSCGSDSKKKAPKTLAQKKKHQKAQKI